MTTTFSHGTSTGHALSNASWLDAHFEACREEYLAMLAFAQFDPGSRLLDAGCGSGSFLQPLLAEGAGEILALDIAREHLLHIHGQGQSAITLEAVAVVDPLPLASASVDGVWCANTLQYLDDAELLAALREFARVTRPGGIVAIKDVDMTAFKIAPAPPLLSAHLAEACITGPDVSKESHGSLRGRELRRFMEQAGLEEVRQRSFLIERWGPLSGWDATFWREWLPYLAALAVKRGVPEHDLETWRQVATPELAEAFISRPDFYGCELQVVCTGRVASRA